MTILRGGWDYPRQLFFTMVICLHLSHLKKQKRGSVLFLTPTLSCFSLNISFSKVYRSMSRVLRLTLTQGCCKGLSQPQRSDASCNGGDTHFSRPHMATLSTSVWHLSFLLSFPLPPDSGAKILNCQIPWTHFRPGHP